MPKALSLKKPPTQSSKGQKAITQFFKVAPLSISKEQTNPIKQDNQLGKRKAISPVVDYETTVKTSPVKENNNEKRSKKSKIEKNYHEALKDTKTTLLDLPDKLCYVNDGDSSNLNRRSPLTSMYNEKNVCVSISPNNSTESFSSSITVHRTLKKLSKNGQNTSNNLEALIEKSPINSLLKSIDNENSSECSPSKGSIIHISEFDNFGGNADEHFADEWDINKLDEDTKEDIDLTTMKRCEVVSIKFHPTKLEIRLKNNFNNRCTCYVEGVWMNSFIQPGEIISILAAKNPMGQYFVNNSYGLISLRPDHLISTTSVVAGVFCKRKAILQERWKGIDSANVAMTIGILIHELVQKALTQNIQRVNELRTTCEQIINESLHMLYDAGINETEVKTNMEQYITPLAEFMQTYYNKSQSIEKAKWKGQIDEVLDIEENICCPELGLKGKIDATLNVTIHEKKGKTREIVPLELKSGRASGSAEHRGQVVLYGMMLSLQRSEDPALSIQRGLLLYLKDQMDVREVSCGYPERRDLLLLRNELVQHLASGPQGVNTEPLDIEEASKMLQQSLPEPVNNENACSKCPYLTLCSLHLWHTNDVIVSESHPLTKLRDTALGHLSSTHVSYFLHWTSLLKLEERAQMSNSSLHALWTDSPEIRSKRGTCAANLKLISVKSFEDKYAHVFEKMDEDKENVCTLKGPKEGEFSIVSLDKRPWIAAGVITDITRKELHILLERNLGSRLNKNTKFHIDTYESYATTVQNLTNLGVLMEDSDRALRLRQLIIDKNEPTFIEKLPREVGRLGSKLMRSLNIEQQRAVLRALSAKDYVLLQGLPGTGKTETISVLIQMLVGLKQRVLVTAHTHSAVDTVLTRLPDSLKVMRLGSASRVARALTARSEATLTQNCNTSAELSKLYDSMDVVGVTCLGASHALLSRTTFDVCIVDEATQVLQCTVLRPLFAAKRLVLVGDPEQLPPVVKSKSARRLGMEESLFHRLMSVESTCTLQLQYRMNQALVDIANKVAYSQRLKCANKSVAESTMSVDEKKLSALDAQWLIEACSRDVEKAAIFFNVESTDSENRKVLTNIDEAWLVLALVKLFIQIGIRNSDIGVIAPYRDQVSLLRQMLAQTEVEVNTVDQFQGRDKSVIIYSCTKRDLLDDKVMEGEILNDQRRLAVSVTRAKHKFIAIGNERALQKYTPLTKLMDACKKITLDKNILLQVREL